MTAATAEPRTRAAFPEKQLIDVIGAWWDEQILERASDPFAPQTLYDVLPDMDSLSAVNIILVLEPIVGGTLSESLIKTGGYNDRQEMIDHLIPRLRSPFTKPTR